MPTPRFRHRSTTSNQSRRDWKDHPLVVGVGAVVATSVFFMTVVIPLRFDLLTSKVERLTELSTNAVATAEELEKTKRKLTDTRASLQASLKKTPFYGHSVYPLGFDEVVVGTSEAELLHRYPNGKWDKENYSYAVKAETAGGVHTGIYYLSRESGQRHVAEILFFFSFDSQSVSGLARKHFLTSFGEPDGKRDDDDFLWKATDREWVILNTADVDFGHYSVHAVKDLSPSFLSGFVLR